MQEEGLTCSVITNQGELPNSPPDRSHELQENLHIFSSSSEHYYPTHKKSVEANLLTSSLQEETLELWNESHLVENSDNSGTYKHSRVRKQKRPYSPILREKRLIKKESSAKSRSRLHNEKATQFHQKPFMCEKCSSPYVVNPARSHSSGKTYTPRRIFDPITKKTLIVCNACRLSVTRSRKSKKLSQKTSPSEEARSKYMEECAQFSASLVEKLKDSDADRLCCPVFTARPCNCIQKYLSPPDEEELTDRAGNLLNLLKKAKHLSAQKNCFSHVQNPRPRGFLKRKSHIFEEFVREMRDHLRNNLKFCERACQRVLMYSNNFLHKQLKSSPDQTARIQLIGGSCRQQLCPISKLANENCCQERCVSMALTHSRLLEDWRATARRSQRDARRVLAEMLTPSGGSKANCYKFIRMVTGCSHTTICLVNEQMWRTQGNREPPEHGLKRWWRQRSGLTQEAGPDHCGTEAGASGDDIDFECTEDEQQDDDDDDKNQSSTPDGEDTSNSNVSNIHIPTARELRELPPAEAGRCLLQQRRKLVTVQRQLAHQQRQLEALRQQRPPIILGCCSGSTDLQQGSATPHTPIVKQPPTVQTVTHQPQVVHILELPSTSSAIPGISDSSRQQTLSVLSSSGEFEPITNISVNVAPGQPMGTVIFVPEFEAVTSMQHDRNSSGKNMILNAGAAEAEVIQLQQNVAPQLKAQVTSQSQTQILATHPSQLPSGVPPNSQPLHLPSMQLHLPLDLPIQLTVQSPLDQPVQCAEPLSAGEQSSHMLPQSQPIIFPAPQSISYHVTPSSSSQHISLQNTSTDVVNMINKDNRYVHTVEPQLYYLETVNCVTSMPD